MLKQSSARSLHQPLPLADNPADRRRQQRVCAQAVRTRMRQQGTTFEPIQSIDVSASGAQIRSPRPLQVGSRLALNLNLSGQMLSLNAAVVWNRPDGDDSRIGVHFDDMLKADRRILSGWIFNQAE